MRKRARVDETFDRLHERDQGADEDRQHDAETGKSLAAHAAEEESEAKRDRRQRVTEVVDQVGEQRDAERARVDERLRDSGDRKDRQAPRDSADAGARAKDRPIDEPVRMIVRTFLAPMLEAVRRSAPAPHGQGVQTVVRVLVAAEHRPVSSPQMAHRKHRTRPRRKEPDC